MIVIITCGKQKLKTKKPVRLDVLYSSRLGKGKMKIARLLTSDDKIFVFSGKLGLVPLSTESAWYDSKNKLPPISLVEKQVKRYKIPPNESTVFIGQKKVFVLLQKIYPGLVNLISNSKGSGDFTRIVYEMINKPKLIENVLRQNNNGKKIKRNKEILHFF